MFGGVWAASAVIVEHCGTGEHQDRQRRGDPGHFIVVRSGVVITATCVSDLAAEMPSVTPLFGTCSGVSRSAVASSSGNFRYWGELFRIDAGPGSETDPTSIKHD